MPLAIGQTIAGNDVVRLLGGWGVGDVNGHLLLRVSGATPLTSGISLSSGIG
jgi:hypothetical protein